MINVARKVAGSFGIHFYRPNPYHLVTDYPVSYEPRYGHKSPPPAAITSLIEEGREEYRSFLTAVAAMKPLTDTIGFEPDANPEQPYWNSGWLPPRDGVAMMHFLMKLKPKRFLEIGSGNSTKFARLAIRHAGLSTIITSIDPEPRAEIDQICDRVVRSGLQDVDLSVFDQLEAGDILSFDGSHRVFTDSDVTVFFLEVVPRLPAGVIIQVHDIFWPMDYPAQWGRRYYSEQYLLGMLLVAARSKIKILLANAFIDQDPELAAIAAPLLPNDPARMARFGEGVWANAFWFELKEAII
jgi:hypothetical protein